jgi:virulence factor Mce-like protein
MRKPFRAAADAFSNPILTGALTLLVAVVAVYLSYTAQNGLPFVPSYQVSAEVPNADELVKDADVRIGGARVGIVLGIAPEPATPRQPHPYARITMSLSKGVEPLPVDSRVGVRLQSVLGGKYIEIQPGHSRTGIADGGTIPVSHAVGVVDLDQVFRTFGPATVRGIRNSVASFGDALAGRGSSLNDTIYYLHRALPPIERVLATLASPRTNLAGFIDGAASTSSALAPVASTLTAAFADAATTFAALNRAAGSFASIVEQLPSTESEATADLRASEPALTDAQTLLQRLSPASVLIAPALRQVDGIAVDATPVFKRVPALIGPLQSTLAAVDKLARDPVSTAAFRIIGNNDLASFSASGFVGLGAILKAAAGGQSKCNLEVPWLLNFSSAISEGDASGAWLRAMIVFDTNELIASGKQSPTLHDNFYPHETPTDCEAGNEGYQGTRLVGNVSGNQSGFEASAPPPGVLARAQRAGLLSGGGS